MRVAIIHDWLVTNAGAEKVLKEIIDLYPTADIFAIVDFLNEKDRKNILKGKFAKTSFIQKLPFAKRYFRNYLPLFPKAIESFDLREYDLIISSSWAFAKGVKKSKNAIHICYCHTPIRYAWDLYDEYTLNLKQPKKLIVQKTLQYIRKWDINSINRVDYFIANSNFVKERIKRIYNKDAKVIYPPVDLKRFTLYEKKEDFYLTASRLVSYKKTKLIVEAFNKMPNKKLIVIGDGEEFDTLKAIAKDNITIMGYQEDNILTSYMQRAKAFVYTAIEDFGIVIVEAQACGTPVIALNKGGSAEIVEDKVSGVLFKNQTISDIILALKEFEKLKFNYYTIRQRALKFNNFKENFKRYVDSCIT
jgi:glycosyltransferase involved in cell wall biosynthesis